MNPWEDLESEVARRRLTEPLSSETFRRRAGSLPRGAELYLIGSGADRTRARVFRDRDGNPIVTDVWDKENSEWRRLTGSERARVQEGFDALRAGSVSLTSVIQGQPEPPQEAAGEAEGPERTREELAGGAMGQQADGPIHGSPPPSSSGSAAQTRRDKSYEDWMGIHPASTVSVVEMGHGENKDYLLEEEPPMPQSDEDSGGGSVASNLFWSFKTTISGGTVTVAGGYRRLEGAGSWGFVSSAGFAYINGGVVYMTRTYPTVQSDGTVNANGSWSALLYGSPPASDNSVNVIRIARTVDGQVIHEHLGNISVIDIVPCVGDDDPE